VETNVGYQVKLFNLVRPNDHPAFGSQGKTSLWIDDIRWSPNDLTCIIAFRAKSIAVITRLGSLIRFVVEPSDQICQNPQYKNDSFTVSPQRFHELVYSREAQNLDCTNDTENIKIMFENDMFVIKDNSKFFIFYFTHSENPMSLLSWCDKEELGFSFLRLCLSHDK